MPLKKASSQTSIIRDTQTDAGTMKETSAPGAPARPGAIPLCVPLIQGNEWDYIKECLDTNWVSSVGSYVDRFEDASAGVLGAKHAIATVNGTAALHIALLLVGVEDGDEVLVSTMTFVAPSYAIRYVGAWPVFVDAEPTYWQMDPELLADFLDQGCNWNEGVLTNKTTGRRVRAIMPVHILGHPCDMTPILELARKYELPIIEDATEGLGADYKGGKVGHLGDISCLSFNGNKVITSGGGGMIVTDNQEWADRARYLTTQAKDDPIEYYHEEIGYNYRLSNIQAAMGVAQMEHLDAFIETKRRTADVYKTEFRESEGITVMQAQPETNPTYWLYTILLPERTTIEQRKLMVADLNAEGIGVRPLWYPNHALPPFAECHRLGGEQANNLHRRAISLPSSVGLTAEEQDRTIKTVKSLMTRFDI